MKNFRLNIIFLFFTCFLSFSPVFSAPSFSYNTSPPEISSKEHLMDVLRYSGYVPGTEFWLEAPVKLIDEYGKLPALSKLTFIDADIVLARFHATRGVIFFVKDSEGNDRKLHLSTDTYYNKEPDGTPYLLAANMYLTKKDLSKKTKKWSKKVLDNIRNQQVQIGMTHEQVRMSFGSPNKINETSGDWGTHEQWIYGEFPDSMYLYMENGRLASVQKSY